MIRTRFMLKGRNVVFALQEKSNAILVLVWLILMHFGVFGQVKNGHIDLSGSKFQGTTPLDLSGTWDFYWNQSPVSKGVFDPGQLTKKEAISLPGIWRSPERSAFGFATYHLTMTGVNQRQLNLNIAEVRGGAEVWCNGRKMGETGTFGTSPESSEMSLIPITVELPKADTLDVYVVLSNFDFRNGGGVRSDILIAQPMQLSGYIQREQSKSAIVVTFLFSIGFFSILMFMLGVKKYPILFFGLMFFFAGFREITLHQNVLASLWETIPDQLVYLIRFNSNYLTVAFGGLYYATLFSREIRIRWMGWFVGILFLFAVVLLITPRQFSSYILEPGQLFLGIVVLYMLVGVTMGLIKNTRHAKIAFTASSLFFLAFVVEILIGYEIVNIPSLLPYCALIFAALNISIVITLFQESERAAAVLNMKLEAKKQDIGILVTDQQFNLSAQKNIIEKFESIVEKSPDEVVDYLKPVINEFKFQNKLAEKNSVGLEHIHEINAEFDQLLSKKYPDLSEMDKEICALIRIKLSNKEIAAHRGTTEVAVRVSKTRIRKKMGLEKNESLEELLRNISL